jgi:hypothetical protein
MSIGSLGIVGSLAAAPQTQRAAEADKSPQTATEQSRTADAGERAELAAGIGQTTEDSGTADRDADGRRLWERPAAKKQPPIAPPLPPATVLGKDPTGSCGGELDLLG